MHMVRASLHSALQSSKVLFLCSSSSYGLVLGPDRSERQQARSFADGGCWGLFPQEQHAQQRDSCSKIEATFSAATCSSLDDAQSRTGKSLWSPTGHKWLAGCPDLREVPVVYAVAEHAMLA